MIGVQYPLVVMCLLFVLDYFSNDYLIVWYYVIVMLIIIVNTSDCYVIDNY